jgi:threonine dehydratase
MSSNSLPVNYRDVVRARERLKGQAHVTPLLTSCQLDALASERLGAAVKLHFKCENLQRVGAFKFRGAFNFVSTMSSFERAQGVVTASSGNHGQAAALACKLKGVKCTVVMPDDAPEAKIDAVRGYGADVVIVGPKSRDRADRAKEISEKNGAVLMPSYDCERIIAGQGTAGLEIVEQLGCSDDNVHSVAVVAPVGGGGLLGGLCVALKGADDDDDDCDRVERVLAFGAEPAGADDARRSLDAGERLLQECPRTVADGLRTSLGVRNFALLKAHCDGIFLASDAHILEAMALIWSRMNIVVEPSAAVPLAVVLNSDEFRRSVHEKSIARIVLLLSGGNVALNFSHLMPLDDR